MRIISGKYKSLKLETLEGSTTRPTTDKVKENMFNILPLLEGRGLDLFGGSGSLGIEAISRGAEHVTFIDGSIKAIKIIDSNLKKLKGLDKDSYAVYRNDYSRALKIFNKKNQKFDFIFLDPPYNKGIIDEALKSIIELNLLNDDSFLICEYSTDEIIKYDNNLLEIYSSKKYGTVNLTIYRYREKNFD